MYTKKVQSPKLNYTGFYFATVPFMLFYRQSTNISDAFSSMAEKRSGSVRAFPLSASIQLRSSQYVLLSGSLLHIICHSLEAASISLIEP